MLSNTITTLSWIALAAPNAGFINATTRAWLGINTIFDIYSFSGIALVLVSSYASFAFVSLYAALRTIDGALEEASYMAGAGAFQTSLRMTLPLIWPSLVASFLIIFVLAAENFSVPTLLGAPFNYQTLTSRIFYDMTVEPASPMRAAAAGTMLLWIALIGTFWQRRIILRTKNYVTVSGKGSRPRLVTLSRTGKIIATGLLVAFVLVAVVIPYGALLFGSFLNFLTPRISWRLFTLSNYTRLWTPDVLTATTNSLLYSVGGGLFLTLFYVLLAYCIKRSQGAAGRLMEYATTIPTSIPGMVLALGILWCFVGLPLPIYGTASILIIAYLVRNIGYGVRQSRVALVQVSEELTEAAQMCGGSPMRAFRDVTVPILQPALLALWTILLMHVFTELSMTILLSNYATATLPVALWNDMATGHQTRAFAIAVVQAVIIFIIIFAANRRWGILRNALER
jgi:iron(III) transport system permease protein